MAPATQDILALRQLRPRLMELVEAVRGGREKILTRNGESDGALLDPRRLDHAHRLERQHVHLTLVVARETPSSAGRSGGWVW